MLSALIPSAGRKPAVLLAEQLAHESCVRPGPLVLGTAPFKSPTPTTDRDRHFCYRRPESPVGGQGISRFAWLCMSPCRSDHLFTTPGVVFGIWPLRILVPAFRVLGDTAPSRSWRGRDQGVVRSPLHSGAPPQPSLARSERRRGSLHVWSSEAAALRRRE